MNDNSINTREPHAHQSIEQVVNAMATVLANYLDYEQVNVLTKRWRQYPEVSVKMMQQSILEATRHFPKLNPYKSEIRKGFWEALQNSAANNLATEDISEQKTTQSSESESVNAFYTVIEFIQNELTAPDSRELFHALHQMVVKERTLKGHSLNMQQFLNHERPPVPDDVQVLNTLVQLTYICLCDILGPVDADDMLYRSAETAKQQHPKAIVEQLF